MANFHFLRPWFLLTLIPVLILFWSLWQQGSASKAWAAICDAPLLAQLSQGAGKKRKKGSLLLLLLIILSMIFALAGPAWIRLALPSYQPIQPRVIVLDMSEAMLEKDLQPERLSRAKFKLHDLFQRAELGQLGLVVYSGEPFVVSPLTDDAQTIDALLSSLRPDIMPVPGQQLDSALREAELLIQNAGFKQGQILVMTAETPSLASISVAKELAAKQISTSVMPILADKHFNPLFQQLATAGQGQLIAFKDTADDLQQWLQGSALNQQFKASQHKDIPQWRDEGRWFLLPALLGFLLVFRRGWLQRIAL